MRDVIERMSRFNQIEVLRILSKHREIINENKYGVHINLSELSDDILNEVSLYLQYVAAQEIELNKTEQEKQTYKDTFFAKDNKDCVSSLH